MGKIADGRGRRSWLPDATVAEVVRVSMHESPDDNSTHWITRTLAKRLGVGKDTVARIWRDRQLRKVDTFKISNDLHLKEELVDVVGLYMDPSSRDLLFSYDERRRSTAFGRTTIRSPSSGTSPLKRSSPRFVVFGPHSTSSHLRRRTWAP